MIRIIKKVIPLKYSIIVLGSYCFSDESYMYNNEIYIIYKIIQGTLTNMSDENVVDIIRPV